MKSDKELSLSYNCVSSKETITRGRPFRLLLAFVVAVVILPFGIMPKVAWADDTEEDMRKRIEELERTVQQQEEQSKATEEKLEELKKDIKIQHEKKEKEDKESIKETILMRAQFNL